MFLLAGWLTACRQSPAAPPTVTVITPLASRPAPVTLVMGSWRTDDVTQMNQILEKFHQKYPSIHIKYETYNTSDITVYNPMIASMLKQGTGPDLFYLTSYGFSRQLFEEHSLEPLDTLPGLKESFKPAMRAPWATTDGLSYGVPFIATSHGVYYNVKVFKELHLVVPETWEQFLNTAAQIKQAGLIPLANASGEGWPMAEIVFMNLAPNFIGGYSGRQAYLDGKRCFNDASMLAAFQAVQAISPFMPENQRFLKYNDSLQLFIQGKAAMWMGGSWDIPFFEEQKPDFEWSVFAVPPPAGQKPYLTFHLDAGMGLNAASRYKNEARLFLSWMTTPEFATLLGNELPGFFPMHTQVPALVNPHARTFLALNQGRETDVRFTWEKISDGKPDAYTLIMDGSVAISRGEMTPQQAANTLQAGLEQWFPPAQTCPK